MHALGRTAKVVMILGDISVLYFSVWITFFIRFGGDPDMKLLYAHLASFSFLFIAWFFVYALAGLYGKYSLVFQRKLPEVIFVAQFFNVIIAAVLFFAVPLFQITPKTILVIYLIVSTVLLYLWRVYMYPFVVQRKPVGAVLMGSGDDSADLATHINKDPHYPMTIHAVMHPELSKPKDIEQTLRLLVHSNTVDVVIFDSENKSLEPLLPFLHEIGIISRVVTCIDIRDIYEEVFERVPLSLIDERWVFEHANVLTRTLFDAIKRVIDVCAALVLLCLAVIVLPLVYVALAIEDGGTLFTKQKRIGRHAHIFTAHKFRTMAYTDEGAWIGENAQNYVTRTGRFLRKTHIDEFPQAWNILVGDMSLVGPRPDISGLYESLVHTVPLYAVRYAIKPGLTGWAQTTQIYANGESPQTLDETHSRLSYDLYYLKHRSLLLDVKIMLRTFATLVTTIFTSTVRT